MVSYIPAPDPHILLPPFLACLPAAFASPRPPPSLLPLLSPVLRQRVQLLSSPTGTGADSWLTLLCWDREKASRIPDVIETGTFEPHPVSGEIDLGDELAVVYKRFDQETLKARIVLEEWGMSVEYLWCTNDQDGGDNGVGWRLAELFPETKTQDEASWSESVSTANEACEKRSLSDTLRDAGATQGVGDGVAHDEAEDDDDADDDYWAQYDNTPGRTPAVKRSPAPPASNGSNRWQSTNTDNTTANEEEAAYFAQYGDVQPALDSHDPEEEQPELGPSSLNGDLLASMMRRQSESHNDNHNDEELARRHHEHVSHPRPTSPPSSTKSDTVSRLEQTAETQSASEIGVRQHISTSIKSLYRLSKTAGMDRGEFQRVVARELEVLGLMDHEGGD